MSSPFYIQHAAMTGKPVINLPASKSLANRALVLSQLLKDRNLPYPEIENISEADDTRLLQQFFSEEPARFNFGNAGTPIRFATAYLAQKTGAICLLDGSERMRTRPIGGLVEALDSLGASINWQGEEGFPPLLISGRSLQTSTTLEIDGTESSQFLSACMLIAPFLPKGQQFVWNPNQSSAAYNLLTLQLMQEWGIEYSLEQSRLTIFPYRQKTKSIANYRIESDWSSAAFFYQWLAAQTQGELELRDLNLKSAQPDSKIAEFMQDLGIVSNQIGKDIGLIQTGNKRQQVDWDFSQCPDLAPACICAAVTQVEQAQFSGLDKLNLKESRRLDELHNQLSSSGFKFEKEGDSQLIFKGKENRRQKISLKTCSDHRLVMAFACLQTEGNDLILDEIHWVDKSFPDFWSQASKIGVTFSQHGR